MIKKSPCIVFERNHLNCNLFIVDKGKYNLIILFINLTNSRI